MALIKATASGLNTKHLRCGAVELRRQVHAREDGPHQPSWRAHHYSPGKWPGQNGGGSELRAISRQDQDSIGSPRSLHWMQNASVWGHGDVAQASNISRPSAARQVAARLGAGHDCSPRNSLLKSPTNQAEVPSSVSQGLPVQDSASSAHCASHGWHLPFGTARASMSESRVRHGHGKGRGDAGGLREDEHGRSGGGP